MDKRFISFFIIFTLAMFIVKFGFNYYENQEREEWVKKYGTEVVKKEQETLKKAETAPPKAKETQKGTEKFYVLENQFQQLVFSTKGASLVEINLPFKTKENPQSVVLPIGFDRAIRRESVENALFPLHSCLTPQGSIKESVIGGYYPLIRRDQIQHKKTVALVPPPFTGFNIVSEFPEVSELMYEVKKYSGKEIVFEAVQPHRRITKTFSFYPNPENTPYCLQLEIKVEGDSRGLWLTSGVPEIEWISGGPGSLILYHFFKGKSSSVEKIDLPKDVSTFASTSPDWVCNSNGFFGIILDPLKQEPGFKAERVAGTEVPSRLSLIDAAYDRFPAKELPGFNVLMPVKESASMKYRIFAGPFAGSVLNQIDNYFAQVEGGRPSNYAACQTFHGWFAFISEPFAKFLFFLMKFFHRISGSWALSIFLITVVLRILLYPLNSWSMKSMKRMQLIAPKMKAIQEKYKKEPQKAQLETLNLYREHGVNPFSGCLPLIIQMPFLIGMFDLLKSAFELRGASFIPGWIPDLSAPDVLFSWGYPLPLIGNEFHLLPLLLAAIMFIQQNMMSGLPKDPSLWTDQQRQQRAMGNIMTLVMAILFYQFPSGLNIYWISSMVLGIGQQWYTNRTIDKETDGKKGRSKKKSLA